MPRYRLMSAHFFAPDLYPANTVIDFTGTPTPEMEPLDKEAEEALQKYFESHPHASVRPFENLPLTMAPQPQEIIVVQDLPKVAQVTSL